MDQSTNNKKIYNTAWIALGAALVGFVVPIFQIVGLILGIISIIQILRKKDQFKGIAISVVAIAIVIIQAIIHNIKAPI